MLLPSETSLFYTILRVCAFQDKVCTRVKRGNGIWPLKRIRSVNWDQRGWRQNWRSSFRFTDFSPVIIIMRKACFSRYLQNIPSSVPLGSTVYWHRFGRKSNVIHSEVFICEKVVLILSVLVDFIKFYENMLFNMLVQPIQITVFYDIKNATQIIPGGVCRMKN